MVRSARFMPFRQLEQAVLGVIWLGIGLLLLIPFVISGESALFPLVVNGQVVWFPPTIFPFTVGKGLLFRCIVEVVFVAWTVLAVVNPAYRPPRSLLLGLLAAALGVAAVSAVLGASTVRSFFSTYERMGGVLDQAHWLAFAIVLVSVVRPGQWRVLLNANLGVGLVVALWAVGQYFGVEALLWEWSREGYGSVTATLGNPIHLGAYVLVNCLVATGFLVESLIPKATLGPGDAQSNASEDELHGAVVQGANTTLLPWLGRLFWGLVALLSAWIVTLTAARSAFLGLVAGFAAASFLFAYMEQGRVRLATGALAGALAAAVVVFAVLVATFERDPDSDRTRFSNPLVDRTLAFSRRTVEMRLAAWDAAVEGFLERPVFGWGPENYVVVLGRHGADVGADMRVHDNAHGRVAEELATKGLLGVASHLAIWTALLIVGIRTATRMGRRERIPLVFVGGALVGYFAQSLVSPDAHTGTLQFILLVAFVAVMSRVAGAPASSSSSGWFEAMVASRLRRLRGRVIPFSKGTGAALGAAAVLVSAALAGLGLWANKTAFAAATHGALAVRSSEPSLAIAPHRTRGFFAEAIDGYPPMANQFRRFLFEYAGHRWRSLRTRHRADAARLLQMVDAEASVAARREPENWEIPLALAKFYVQVSATEPGYRAVAARQVARARELAPNRYEVRALPEPGEPAPDRIRTTP